MKCYLDLCGKKSIKMAFGSNLHAWFLSPQNVSVVLGSSMEIHRIIITKCGMNSIHYSAVYEIVISINVNTQYHHYQMN